MSTTRRPAHAVATAKLINPTVRTANLALQQGDRQGWAQLFEPGARLYDDGNPRSLEAFSREAVGHEHFTSIDQVDNQGLDVVYIFTPSNGAISASTSGCSCPRQAGSIGSTLDRPTDLRSCGCTPLSS